MRETSVPAEAVSDRVGLTVPREAAREIAEDCVAMVDGFATPGPRHRRARTPGFAHEVRRFCPCVPFVGGLAAHDLGHRGEKIPEGTLVLLDVYGHHHDPGLFAGPTGSTPPVSSAGSFLGREPDPGELIPQGGGDARTGHRCPGEDVVTGVLAGLATGLGRLDHTVPGQDPTIPLRRVPTRPRSGSPSDRSEPGPEPGRRPVGAGRAPAPRVRC
ncbi:hypothetical protein ACFXA3_13310 [Streptomyces sp. NPDC059456]|uniref:hypothetical protein n=1 Tax=Streptomyces sp. NPDC059456 TaxID=3346838 RepID=UPI003673B287